MFIRVTTARGHRYVQLVHKYRDRKTGVFKTKVLHSFGREDALDVEALRRLARAVARYLGPEAVEDTAAPDAATPAPEFVGALDLGLTWLLDRMWHRLDIHRALGTLLSGYGDPVIAERILFSLVARTALANDSQLDPKHWLGHRVWIPGLSQEVLTHFDDVLTFLHGHVREASRRISLTVSSKLGLRDQAMFLAPLQADLELDDSDRAVADHPRAATDTYGLIVSESGIPTRLWKWPAASPGNDVVPLAKRDLEQSLLGRMLVVLNTAASGGLPAMGNPTEHFITCERLRPVTAHGHEPGAHPAARSPTGGAGVVMRRLMLEDGPIQGRFTVVYNYSPDGAEDELAAPMLRDGFAHWARARALLAGLPRRARAEARQSRAEDSLRLHVLFCWLALLLLRIVELETGMAWPAVKASVGGLQVAVHGTEASKALHTNRLTEEQAEVFRLLGVDPPPADLGALAADSVRAPQGRQPSS